MKMEADIRVVLRVPFDHDVQTAKHHDEFNSPEEHEAHLEEVNASRISAANKAESEILNWIRKALKGLDAEIISEVVEEVRER